MRNYRLWPLTSVAVLRHIIGRWDRDLIRAPATSRKREKRSRRSEERRDRLSLFHVIAGFAPAAVRILVAVVPAAAAGIGERAVGASTLGGGRRNRVRGRASAGGEVVHDSLVGELGERVEANGLRGGQLSLRDQRLDLVRDSLASAEVVGGLDDRGDVLPARTSVQGRAADDGRSGSCDPAGSLRSANPTPTARANSGDCRDCHGDDCPAHGARRIDLSVHCGFLLLWLVCRSAPLTMRRARSACCQTSRAGLI